MRLFTCLLPVVVGLVALPVARAENTRLPLKLKVAAGDVERSNSAVSFILPDSLKGETRLRLVEIIDGREKVVPVQRDETDSRLWWTAEGQLAAGQTRTYRLESGESRANAPRVTLRETATAVEAVSRGKPLLRYNKGHVEPGAGIDPRYGRSGHLHPVWSPGGAVVTDEFPPDHLHQSGIFLAYTRTRFEGRSVDFWNLVGGKGRVRFGAIDGVASGPVFGELRARHEHVDLMAEEGQTELGKTSGGKVALNEAWRLRIWPAGLEAGYWLLEIDSTQQCATDSPLVLPEYHYGGMAIRAAREWTPGQVTFLTSEGDERIKGNHTRPKWCDIRGSVGGKTAGIAAMTHPSNFRFPEPLRIHPTMPYMVYTPQVLGEFKIEPGQSHRARYLWVVHDGRLAPADLNRLWADFAEPLVAVAE